MFARLAFLLLLVPLTGCLTFKPGDGAALRSSVLINGRGQALGPARRDSTGGSRVLSDTELDAHVRTIIDEIRSSGTRRVMVVAHGGLNSMPSSWDRVRLLGDSIRANGYYPVFINWDSHLVKSTVDFALNTNAGRIHRLWWPLRPIGWAVTATVVPAKLAGAIIEAPRTEVARGVEFFGSLFATRPVGADTSIGGLEVSVAPYYRPPLRKRISRETLQLAQTPFKLLSGIAVDAFGPLAWDGMRQRTHSAFRPAKEYRNPLAVGDASVGTEPTGAAGRFLTALADHQREHGVEVTFIGHSMGAFLGNAVLTETSLRVRRLVYFAGAAPVLETVHATVPYLEANPAATFHIVTLHPSNEALESRWLGFVPRGSLLQWVDGSLSEPNHFAERTIGKYENAVRASHLFPDAVRARVSIRTFGRGGPTSQPVVHGGFFDPNMGWWREEFWAPQNFLKRERAAATR